LPGWVSVAAFPKLNPGQAAFAMVVAWSMSCDVSVDPEVTDTPVAPVAPVTVPLVELAACCSTSHVA
jgi:hypothetical protein